MDNLNKSNFYPSDKKIDALDAILLAKSDQERLAEWKTKMPLPPQEKRKKNYIGLAALLLSIGILIYTAGYFILKVDSTVQFADNLINTTVIASAGDMNSRGENATNPDNNLIKLNSAVDLLKGDNAATFEAIEILTQLSKTKNKYQIEAVWFTALAYVKVGNNKKATLELDRLKSLSNYQSKNVNKLLERID